VCADEKKKKGMPGSTVPFGDGSFWGGADIRDDYFPKTCPLLGCGGSDLLWHYCAQMLKTDIKTGSNPYITGGA